MRGIWSALVLYVFINATTPVVVCVMIREWQLLVAWPNHFFIPLFLFCSLVYFSGPSQVFILMFFCVSLVGCGDGGECFCFAFPASAWLLIYHSIPVEDWQRQGSRQSPHTASDVSFRLTLLWRNSERCWHFSFVIASYHEVCISISLPSGTSAINWKPQIRFHRIWNS